MVGCKAGGPNGRVFRSQGKVNLPKVIGGGIAVAGEHGFLIMGNCHVVLGESGYALSMEELANGEERGVEVVKHVSLGCSNGGARDGKASLDDSAIGHHDRDGVMLTGHIGKAGCSGRKEMACGAGVSNDRDGIYRWGRGINWFGHNGFI